MAMSVDFQPRSEIQAVAKTHTDFVTLDIKSADAGTITIYLHSVEDAKAIYVAARDAIAQIIHLESDLVESL